MKINIRNIPLAIIYMLIGAFMNLIFYYVLSPSQANLLGILEDLFNADTTLTAVIYFGVMTVSVLVNLIYPVWMVLEEEKPTGN